MFDAIDTFIETMLQGLGVWGPIVGCFFILIESMVPILPLFVFITLNFLVFGNILGFIISWVFTCIGCLISFALFRNKVQTWLFRRVKNAGLISKQSIEVITNLKFEVLATLIAIPFTPAFLINIVAGLSKMKVKKFVGALLIGKVFLVGFWGLIGTSLIESIKHPINLLKVVILLVIAYVVSKIVSKKIEIE